MRPTARQAQSFSLGMGVNSTGAATRTLTGTAQIPTLLMDLQIMSQIAAGGQSTGLVTALRVAGQRIDVSNVGSDIQAWRADSQSEMQRSIGIPIDSQQVFSIDITPTNAADVIGAHVGSDPIMPSQFVPTTELGEGLNYVCGLGSVVVPNAAPGTANLIATIRRPCKLGRLGITLLGAAADLALIEVRSITINNLEFLCGASGPGTPVDAVPALNYSWLNTDRDGNTLAVDVGVNDQINMTFFNGGAAPVTAFGAIFCMPSV